MATVSGAGPRYYVGVGGQKCGTGWLSSVLKQRPEFLRHSIKEMHVFDCLVSKQTRRYWMPRFERSIEALEAELAACASDASAARRAKAVAKKLSDRRDHLAIVQARTRAGVLQRYERYFADRLRPGIVRPEVAWFGEITPAYALLPVDGFRAILSVYPDAAVVFIMRDPVDRLWSSLKMRQLENPDLDAIATFDDALRTPWIARRSAYDTTIEVLDQVVPPTQQLVLFYEDLFSPATTEVDRLGGFFGLERFEPDRMTIRNRGVPADLPVDLQRRAAEALQPTYRYVFERFGRVPERWREHMAGVA